MTTTPLQRRTLAWIAIALVALALLWLLGPVLTPFVVGAVLAYVLVPAVEALVRRRVPRALAAVAVEAAAILVVLLVLLLVLPIVSRQLPLLREQLPLLAERVNQSIGPLLAQWGVDVSLDLASLKAFFAKALDRNLDEWAGAAFESARIGGSFVLALIGNAIVMPLVVFYLLLDWPNLVERVRSLVPPRAREGVESFMRECDVMVGQYLRGQLLVMLILAAYYSIGLALFGFDLALPVGVLTGLLIFIPYLGFGLGLVLALVAAVLQFGGGYGPADRELLPHAGAGGRAHRAEPADGDLRAARVRPSVRLRRRADRAARERGRGGGAAARARRLRGQPAISGMNPHAHFVRCPPRGRSAHGPRRWATSWPLAAGRALG
jgi:predicted PurR-regulated permease PerM